MAVALELRTPLYLTGFFKVSQDLRTVSVNEFDSSERLGFSKPSLALKEEFDMERKGFDLNEKGSPGEFSESDEGQLVSSCKEGAAVEKPEENAECREEAEGKAVQLVENGSKRSRVESSEDKEDVDSISKRLKREGLDSKLQLPGAGRALRSRFALKTGSEKEVDQGESADIVDGKKTDTDGDVKKMTEIEKEEIDNTGKVTEVKRRRGRPPKLQVNESKEVDQCESADVVDGKKTDVDGKKTMEKKQEEIGNSGEVIVVKRKRGRPPKVQVNESKEVDQGASADDVDGKKTDCNVDVKKSVSVQESDHFHDEATKEVKHQPGMQPFKRKRGRPPKVKESDGFEKKKVVLERERNNDRFTNNGIEEDLEGSNKHNCRRSNAVQLNEMSPKKSVNVEKGDYLDDEVGKAVQHECGRPHLKRKRGRPPLKRRPGRPPKVQQSNGFEKKKVVLESERGDHSNVMAGKGIIHKRGRPRKVHGSWGVLKGKLNEVKSGPLREGKVDSKLRNSLKQSDSERTHTKYSKKVNFSDLERGNNEALQSFKGERSAAKQAMRDRIIKLLLAAGWTIDYRPRSGRDYNDAVYVNPAGKTHWSVTLAYQVLKESCESSNADSKTSDFTFTPIPEEELSILKKVMTKKRVGKKKKKKKLKGKEKDENTDSEGEFEKKKRKQKWKLKPKQRYDGRENGKKRKKQKRKFQQNGEDESDDSAGTSNKAMLLSGRKYKRKETQNRKRCALLVRNSMDGAESSNDGYVLYDGKRTVLAWMIDLGTVAVDEKVQYLNQGTQALCEGRITRDGILCDCCNEMFIVEKFESHTGSKLNEPFQNICLLNGKSLLECMYDSWNKQEESKHKGFHFVDVDGEDPNDDTCGICGDGGDLICCDSCPSTFHQSCLDVNKFPSGDWHCIYCTCKYCGMVGEKMNQNDNEEDKALSALFTCCLCEEKYHQLCIMKDAVSDDPDRLSFCGKKCQELFERLQMLVGVKHELEEGFSWTLTHRFDISPGVSLNDSSQKVETNSRLAVALSVMDECFLPLVDHKSGINLIRNIVYNFGSNFNRLNYSGFLTAILERGDEITAAASIRIHGNHLAEMPFIGTRYVCRRQGMCRLLLHAIESALRSLKVEKLVIPAVLELRETWTSVFGFKPLDASSRQKMKNMNILVFPGIDMLQKPLLMNQFTKENMICSEGVKSSKLSACQIIDERPDNSGEWCSAASDLSVSDEGTASAFYVPAPDGSTVDLDSGLSKASEVELHGSNVKDDTNSNHKVEAFAHELKDPLDHLGGSGIAPPGHRDVHPCGIPDIAIEKADSQPLMNTGVSKPTELTKDSCEVALDDSHDSKATIPAPQTVSSVAKQILNAAEHLKSAPQDDNIRSMQCASETLCELNPASGVPLHCASNEGKSCSPEVVVLSNKAR
ncbi:hypothetical protein SLE2022_245130 [Rubroshorea leprosula]